MKRCPDYLWYLRYSLKYIYKDPNNIGGVKFTMTHGLFENSCRLLDFKTLYLCFLNVQKAFFKKKIFIPVVWKSTGSLHCVTKQQ